MSVSDLSVGMLLSGGVDSAAALKQLKLQGYQNITAYYLKIWLEDELSYLGQCPWEEDLKYAQQTCDLLNVPLQIISLQTEYLNKVVDSALEELKMGLTPSPDIYCNERIKFGSFYDKVNIEHDYIASGHYAQIKKGQGGQVELHLAPDPVKDQTYFLSNLSQQQLQKCLFPIGHFQKKEVRAFSDQYELPPKNRKDSQGICFLGKIPYREFVKHHLGEKEGDIIDLDNEKVIGRHKGSWFHTIGQRKGLGLGQGPWFVVDKDLDKNIVYVSHLNHYNSFAKSQFYLSQMNWINHEPNLDLTYNFKLRHGPEMVSGKIFKEADSYFVQLNQSDSGLAPGQHAVIYHGSQCLGGGMIHWKNSK